MRQLRQLHLYLGAFFAPAILLFSISGGLQTYRLQEAKGYGGTPTSWIAWIASVHKNQRPPKVEAPEGRDRGPAPLKPRKAKAPSSLGTEILKVFTALLSLGLTLSTLLGLIVAFNSRAGRRVTVPIFFAGAVLPLLVLYL